MASLVLIKVFSVMSMLSKLPHSASSRGALEGGGGGGGGGQTGLLNKGGGSKTSWFSN